MAALVMVSNEISKGEWWRWPASRFETAATRSGIRLSKAANLSIGYKLIDSSVSFGAKSIDSSVSFGAESIDRSVSFRDKSIASSQSFESEHIDSSVSFGAIFTDSSVSFHMKLSKAVSHSRLNLLIAAFRFDIKLS